MRIVDYGHEFHVFWEFDRWHKRNLEAVKSIEPTEERRYVVDPKHGRKYWWVSGKQRPTLLEWRKSHAAEIVIPQELTPEEVGELPPMAELLVRPDLKPEVVLRPYQGQGIAQGMLFKKCLIGDEPGLGKTIQSIGITVGLNAFPCIVVCPSTLKLNWQREWHKFSNKKALVLDSTSMSAQQKKNWFSYVEHGMVDVVIVNYESVLTFCVDYYPTEKLPNGKKKAWAAKDVVIKPFMNHFKSAILDESHRCKDAKTNQSKFILRIFNAMSYKVLLSGTPVVNKPMDLFPQLAILGVLTRLFAKKVQATGQQPTMENITKFYKDRYCDGGNGASNMKELNYLINLYCFFRREKKDVAKDLPEKMRQTILCDITTRADYNRCLNDFKKYLKDSGALDDEAIERRLRGEIMTKMMQLKQISAKGKMNEVREFVNEIMEAGEKLVLFCHLHEIVNECLNEWPHAVTITGKNSQEERQAAIDKFQEDSSCQLIICTHKAAGVGVTLTASYRVAFIEYPWTYADCIQCEDRTHRIGQKNTVMCTYFLGQDTVDERMWEIIEEKMVIGNTIIGASDTMNMEMVDKTMSLFK